VTTLRVGDRVIGLPHGNGFADTPVREHPAFSPMPEQMTFEQAAALPIVYQTSYFALTHRTKLRAGETLLVHAGASGVGNVGVQIGKALGARVNRDGGQHG